MAPKEKMKPYMKVLYWIAGVLCLLIGIAFLFLPVLPAIPFLGLSAFLLSMVSERIRRAILSLPFARKWLNWARTQDHRKLLWIVLAGTVTVLTIAGVSYWIWKGGL